MSDRDVFDRMDVKLLQQVIRRHAALHEPGRSGFAVEFHDDDYATVTWRNEGTDETDHREEAGRLAGLLSRSGYHVRRGQPAQMTLIVRKVVPVVPHTSGMGPFESLVESLSWPAGFLDGSRFKEFAYKGTSRPILPGFSLHPEGGYEYGIYVTPNFSYAQRWGNHVARVVVSMKRPLIVENKGEISPADLTKSDIQKLESQGYDSIVSTSSGPNLKQADEFVLFRTSQVYVMEKRY